MLPRLTIPGLFVTGTDTGVGKTIVAAAIADHFRRQGLRVGAFKPAAAGCDVDHEGNVVCEDAERLRAAIGDRFLSSQICPEMFVEPLAPAVAARREGRPIDWSHVRAMLAEIVSGSDIIIIEGIGGIHAPLDDRTTVLTLIRALVMPTVCVTRPSLGTLNHTMLSVEALRSARVECAGVVINRFPMRDPTVAEQTAREEIERLGGGPVRCVVPEAYFEGYAIPTAIADAIDLVDWSRLARLQ